jgi:hypothetical protein
MVYWTTILVAIILELATWIYFMRDYDAIPDGEEFPDEWRVCFKTFLLQ